MSIPTCYYPTQVLFTTLFNRATLMQCLFFNHALTPIQCDVPMPMKCNAPLHVISCHMYNEYYMDNTIHTTYRVSWTITSPAYDFHTSFHSCQYIMHTYININIQHIILCSSNDMHTIKPCNVTPQPSTRWGVKRGCHTSGLGLFNLFFLRADTCTCFLIHMHNFYNNKKKKFLLHIHYIYHHSGIHVLYTESHYFSIYKAYTYSKIQRLRK